MSLRLSLDLTDASFADLEALVHAAHAAGVNGDASISLDSETRVLDILATKPKPRTATKRDYPKVDLSESAVRSVIDILTGRQEPPKL